MYRSTRYHERFTFTGRSRARAPDTAHPYKVHSTTCRYIALKDSVSVAGCRISCNHLFQYRNRCAHLLRAQDSCYRTCCSVPRWLVWSVPPPATAGDYDDRIKSSAPEQTNSVGTIRRQQACFDSDLHRSTTSTDTARRATTSTCLPRKSQLQTTG